MVNPEPTSQHRWLHQLLGDWTCESTADMGTGEAPMQGTGTEHVRALGGLGCWAKAPAPCRAAIPVTC